MIWQCKLLDHLKPVMVVQIKYYLLTYYQIASTLCEVLRRKKPLPDTLGLSKHVRIKLCFYLLDDQLNSWKDLSEHLGICRFLFVHHHSEFSAPPSNTPPNQLNSKEET